MLNLEFKNGQAPALNDVNMNAIVGAINGNENKINDLQTELVEVVVEKGGSIVQANPSEEPTEKMKAIRINNDVFEVASETGIDMTYEDYMALVEADQDAPDTNYFVEDAPTSSVPVAEEFEKVYSEIDDLKESLNNKIMKDEGGKSLPFTAPSNGLLVLSYTNASYCYITADISGEIFTSFSGNAAYSQTMTIPVIKGRTYRIADAPSTISFRTVRFYSIN